MRFADFGLSNVYLKFGTALLLISAAVIVAVLANPSATPMISGRMTGFLFLSGAALYVIGRFVRIKNTRSQA